MFSSFNYIEPQNSCYLGQHENKALKWKHCCEKVILINMGNNKQPMSYTPVTF